MKIGVDLHVLNGINQGSKTYLDNLYTAVQEWEKPKHNFVFYFNDISGIDSKWASFGEIRRYRTTGRTGRLVFGAAMAQIEDGLDLFHSQYIRPLSSVCGNIVTIHDLLYETHPEFFSKAFVIRSRTLIKWSAARSKHVLTVSEYSRRQLIERYKLAPSQVSITSNGVDRDAFKVDRSAAKEYVRSKYGCADYILTVGRLEPRKNHLGLLKAYKILKERHSDFPKLVFVGQRDFGFESMLRYISENDIQSDVKIIEDAKHADLIRLYRAAYLFVYPSFAEGFGIPPLEAMAADCPVVCSNTTSMNELFSSGARMVDPHDIEELVNAIFEVCNDSELQNRLRVRGDAIAEQHTWRAAARNLVTAFDSVDC
ncbi:glycosyltransferase family 4 protein [Paraburkholderia caffeinilytica]|uniref:glycosyltransferase family 4 protein n=1 Tax=Paraburkholderia caffeinilytica TaxID=1761016 RepID=UPI000E20E6E1|nr:glycosyltransferase family 1 protein [Paraburkholderia caffeinilytica]CAB3804542.1 D-inositol-3-phosphate glycosyltransferase [Paraburkholderia caffeinilytica]